MEDKQLTEKQSLELISQMITSTQRRLEKSDGQPFLVWGYTTIFVSLLVYYFVSTTEAYQYHYLWFLIPVLGNVFMYLTREKNNSEEFVRTHIDRMVGHIWTVNGSAALLVGIGAFIVNLPVLQLIILLMGMGTALTGLTIKYRLIAVSGFLGMAFSALPYLIAGYEKILIFSAIFLVMMVIPGHIIRYKNRKKHV